MSSENGQVTNGKAAAPAAGFDKLLARGGGGVALAVLFWMNTTLTNMQQSVSSLKNEVTKVTTELSLVSPKDVQSSLLQLQKSAVTKDDVRELVTDSAPWIRDKSMVLESLRRLEERVTSLERRKSNTD